MANVIIPADRTRRLKGIYGPTFPDLDAERAETRIDGWRNWIQTQIQDQGSVMQDKRLHWARHRLFKQGRQWVSSRDGRTWRELASEENRIRAVFNMIGPALDFRRTLLQEQRPGFFHMPIPGQGVSGRETAEAQQSVAEYYFQTQKIWALIIQAAIEAQTDGVCWLNVYLDKTMGPLMDHVDLVDPSEPRYEGLASAGYKVRDSGLLEIPLGPEGEPGDPGSDAVQLPGGDIRTKLIRAHETWADPEAWTINGADRRARWFLIRRLRDVRSARIQLDDPELRADVQETDSVDPLDLASAGARGRFQRGLPAFPTTRVTMPEGGVWEHMIYFAPSEEFPEGMWQEVVGRRHIRGRESLPGQRIPIARITDGSSDADLYPMPKMTSWTGDQMAINALGSKLLEIARAGGGSRILALEGTTITESWTDIVGSIVEYKGPKPDRLDPQRASPDLWRLWVQMIRQLEDKTGWTSVARGQLTGEGGFQDVAGRAILAARELFERQFGDMIRATAQGTSDWADLVVLHAQYLFKTPRLIPIVGRPDLAKAVTAEKLKGTPSVYVDPETLQPLPRALKHQLLTDMLERGLITVAEYKKRAPFAEIRDLNMGDSDQWQRAQMRNSLLEMKWEELVELEPVELYDVSSGISIFWQDDPGIHMRALEELIFDDRKPFQMRKLAADIWGIYSELQKSKDFPVQLELQGFQRPPAPAEVLGVPNVVQQRAETSVQLQAQGQDSGPIGPQQSASPAPEMAGMNPPSTMADLQQ